MKDEKLVLPKHGDLVEVYWHDASIGASLGGKAAIEVPVRSWGIYVGSVGLPPHLVLCQNDFAYNREMRAIDYTAIPQGWAVKIVVVQAGCVNVQEAEAILKNILAGESTRRRSDVSKVYQRRVDNGKFH